VARRKKINLSQVIADLDKPVPPILARLVSRIEVDEKGMTHYYGEVTEHVIVGVFSFVSGDLMDGFKMKTPFWMGGKP